MTIRVWIALRGSGSKAFFCVFAQVLSWSAANGGLRDGGLSESEDI